MYLILDRDDKRNNQYKDHQYRQKVNALMVQCKLSHFNISKLFVSFKYEAESEGIIHQQLTIKKKRILVMMVKMD